MIDISKITEVLRTSPAADLMKLRNRETVIIFLINTYSNTQGAVVSENIHSRLADYLEYAKLENDDESDIDVLDSYENKAKKYIQKWTNQGYLTNYQDDRGEIFYELSSHSSKVIDWLLSLQKEEYIGTESKFKNIFSQLKELVEFTNENIEKRLELLESKKLEIEQQIQKIKTGEDLKVFENYEIIPRFNQLNQSAKELLSDFKEVEDNFKEITKTIYQKHSDTTQTKSDILEFTFESLDELKNSPQGKSFYAFWSFLLNPGLQKEWETLIKELYQTLEEKGIPVGDIFLKGMKRHLHYSGQRVYKANDKMAEKLGRIIREKEASTSEITKNLILDIKKTLIEISKTKTKPDISLSVEGEPEIKINFERKITFDQTAELVYNQKPSLADEDITHSTQLKKLFKQSNINKDLLRNRIKNTLQTRTQATLLEIIEQNGGLEKGLAELFGYLSILKEFNHIINPEEHQRISFNIAKQKSIVIPEIIISR